MEIDDVRGYHLRVVRDGYPERFKRKVGIGNDRPVLGDQHAVSGTHFRIPVLMEWDDRHIVARIAFKRKNSGFDSGIQQAPMQAQHRIRGPAARWHGADMQYSEAIHLTGVKLGFNG